MPESQPQQPSARREFQDGAVAMLPAAMAVIPFGLLLGALAAAKGLSALEVLLMSGLVFAGSAQFIAVEIWTEPAPWALLALTAFTVNLRHVMMSASLARRLGTFTPLGKVVGLFFLADEVWALAERRGARQGLHWAFYAGLATVMYLNWLVWTVLGTGLGALIADPAAWGFDFAFTALFIGLIVAFWKGTVCALVVVASAAVAIAVERQFGGVWHIVVGGLAGMAAAAALARQLPARGNPS